MLNIIFKTPTWHDPEAAAGHPSTQVQVRTVTVGVLFRRPWPLDLGHETWPWPLNTTVTKATTTPTSRARNLEFVIPRPNDPMARKAQNEERRPFNDRREDGGMQIQNAN